LRLTGCLCRRTRSQRSGVPYLQAVGGQESALVPYLQAVGGQASALVPYLQAVGGQESALVPYLQAVGGQASALVPSRCVHIPRLVAVIAAYSAQLLPCRLCIIVCASSYVSADVTIDDTC
jgi:hypothetical protein